MKKIFLILLLFAVVIAACTVPPPPGLGSCDDEDGRNYYVRGKTTQCNLDGTCDTQTDTCAPEDIVIEYYCDGNEMAADNFRCPNSCSNGMCESEEPPVCLDSDGGDNIYEKGTLTGVVLNTGENPVDYCTGDDVLVEYACDDLPGYNSPMDNLGWWSKSVPCEYGCENGACLEPEPDSYQLSPLASGQDFGDLQVNSLTEEHLPQLLQSGPLYTQTLDLGSSTGFYIYNDSSINFVTGNIIYAYRLMFDEPLVFQDPSELVGREFEMMGNAYRVVGHTSTDNQLYRLSLQTGTEMELEMDRPFVVGMHTYTLRSTNDQSCAIEITDESDEGMVWIDETELYTFGSQSIAVIEAHDATCSVLMDAAEMRLEDSEEVEINFDEVPGSQVTFHGSPGLWEGVDILYGPATIGNYVLEEHQSWVDPVFGTWKIHLTEAYEEAILHVADLSWQKDTTTLKCESIAGMDCIDLPHVNEHSISFILKNNRGFPITVVDLEDYQSDCTQELGGVGSGAVEINPLDNMMVPNNEEMVLMLDGCSGLLPGDIVEDTVAVHYVDEQTGFLQVASVELVGRVQ